MSKPKKVVVTRIAYSKYLTASKLGQLSEIAERLGNLRRLVWDKFGSVQGVETNHRAVRDSWLAAERKFDVPARLWKETLPDVFDDIKAYRAACIEKVKQCIRRHTKNEVDQKRLYKALDDGSWVDDSYLRSRMRKYFKHGHTSVNNQIVLDAECYAWFQFGGKGWIEVMSLKPRQRIAIPLGTTQPITGTIRLILRDGKVEAHHIVEAKVHAKSTACGEAEIGIDKGYSEAFVDSDGLPHGDGLGKILSVESDALKLKYQRRNKLKAVIDAQCSGGSTPPGNMRKKPHKRERILKNNLRRQKLNRRRSRHQAKVKTKIYSAVHTIVDKAKLIATEDLTSVIKSKPRGKDTNRRLSGWVKGIMADALEQVSLRRGASVVLVNAAYTSQACSQCDCLGNRKGDTFYCTNPECGVVLHADHNAALIIKSRLYDPEIGRWMPFHEVKSILLERQRHRLKLPNQDSRYDEGGIYADITSRHSESEMTQYSALSEY